MLTILLLIISGRASAQSDLAPQLYNNVTVASELSEKAVLFNTLSYNVLLNKDFKWNEIAINSSLFYNAWKNIDLLGSAYLSYVNQTSTLSNIEIRPVIGLRWFRSADHRFVISNLTRFEFRFLLYSDEKYDLTMRIRNKTNLLYSINRKSMHDPNNFFLLAYVEMFYNIDSSTRERFFNNYKIKVGSGYRLNEQWQLLFGVIYQDSQSTIAEPVTLPTNYITNYILEWNLLFMMPTRKMD